MNFAKFLRTPFFTEHLRWLLLDSKNAVTSKIKNHQFINNTINKLILRNTHVIQFEEFKTCPNIVSNKLTTLKKYIRDITTHFSLVRSWDNLSTSVLSCVSYTSTRLTLIRALHVCAPARLYALPIINTRLTRLRSCTFINKRLTSFSCLACYNWKVTYLCFVCVFQLTIRLPRLSPLSYFTIYSCFTCFFSFFLFEAISYTVIYTIILHNIFCSVFLLK